ncbi:hypothetical protein [Listeria seeligeri]|nr:hypothetical protein [Listeria seeligeri]
MNEISELSIDDVNLLINVSSLDEDGYSSDDTVPFDKAFPMFFAGR